MSSTPFTEPNFDSIPSVDISILHSFDDPDMSADLVTELIELYLIETARLLDSINSSLSDGEWRNAKRSAHTIKGSSANLGLLKLERLSEQLEYGAHTSESALALLQLMRGEFSVVSVTLNAELQKRKRCAF